MSGDLGHVVSGTSEWGMVENVGVASEIALPSFSVQKLFLLPVCVIAILRFPCRPTSGHVVSGISDSCIVENVWVAAEIALPSFSVQKLFLLPACFIAILRFPCRPMSGHVVSGISESSIVDNVGVAAEIELPSFSVQTLFLLPVCTIAILRFPCRPTSAHVVSGITESGMVENVG